MKLLIQLLLCVLLFPSILFAKSYYISADGDDSNDGSQSSPWKTLTRASIVAEKAENGGLLMAGDSLLFRAGDTFEGNFLIRCSGSIENPIIISSYGVGEKPILSGSGNITGGDYFEAIKLLNTSNLVIENLWVKNDRRDGSRYSWGEINSYGILVSANKWGGISSNLKFQNLKISDVYGLELPSEFNALNVSGIRLQAEANEENKEIAINDILVENCYFTHIGKAGVWAVHKGTKKTDDDTYNRNQNIVIRNNTFYQTGGSGVILSGTYNGLIENNDFDHTGYSNSSESRLVGRGSGAWVFSSCNIIAQYNRSYSIRGPNDSYGMHIDFGNKDIIFQYNYSEDSQGGFCEILGRNINSTYRYNVSVNDGFRDFHGYTIWLSGYAGKGNTPVPSEGNYIYNNTIYLDAPTQQPDIHIFAKDTYIYNNIFYATGNAKIGYDGVEIDMQENAALLFKNNLFFGNIANDFSKLDNSKIIGTAPLFLNPTVTDEKQGFNIEENSPVIKAGKKYPEPDFPMAGKGIFKHISPIPIEDAFGNHLNAQNNRPNIGASNAYNNNTITSLKAYQATEHIFVLFPNLITDKLNIKFENPTHSKLLKVYNIQGKEIYTSSVKAGANSLQIQLPINTKNGIYFIKVIEDSVTQIKRFVLFR